MEIEGRLVGEHIHVVVVDVHAVGHLLDDDATGAIADEPVQQGFLLAGHDLGDEGHVLQGFLDLIHGIEVTGHPQREFEGGYVDGAVDRLMGEGGVAGEVKPRDGQSVLVGAVEIHRLVGHDHADANHRIRFGLSLGSEHIVILVGTRGDQNGLSVGEAPVEITAEIHVSFRIGETDASAHNGLLPFACHLPVDAFMVPSAF